MAPSQATNYTLSCSKTSNATANSEATSTTNTTFTLSISGTSILKGSAYQCAGIATIPNGITSIEFGAFVPWNQNNSPLTNAYLTSIVWPTSSLTAINYGLINLTGLTSLDIPSSVTSISSQAIQNTASLTSATVEGPTSSANTLTLPYYMFNQDTLALNIGNGYVNIGSYFDNGSNFTAVNLGPNVLSIGQNAFEGQSQSNAFTSIAIPTALTTIGDAAFADDRYLKTISFGIGKPALTSIASNSFGISGGHNQTTATVITSVQYCGLINPALDNSTLDTYLFANLPNASIYCSQSGTAPTVASLNPNTGLAAGGDTLTVQGANLASAKVFLNGSALAVSNNTSTSLQVVTPTGTAGTAQLKILTNYGSVNQTFTYVNKLANPISITSTPAVTYHVGDTYTPTATAPGGSVAITVDGSSSSNCSLDGAGLLHLTHWGSCVIDFNQSGNSTYSTATQSQQTISVSAFTITTQNVPVITPVLGAMPETSTVDNGQYTTSISWNGSPATFAANTVYTAQITVVPDSSYSLAGVAANFFTVNGVAATSGNLANAGVFTETFAATAKTTLSIANVAITAPVLGATPQSSITDNGQYSATISWNGSPSTFAANTTYTASVTVVPDTAYTVTGVAANFFTVNGAAPTTGNLTNGGVFSKTFPAYWSISFLPNGGTGTQSQLFYQSGGTVVALPLTTTMTAPTGKSFGGWAATALSTTPVTTPYSTAAAVNYYAIWTQNNHTVTFHINGGDGSATMPNQTVNAPSALSPNAYTYSGHYFLAWNTSADGTGIQYLDGAQYQFLANIDLYAQWGHVVTYSNTGSDSGSASRTSDGWTSGAISLPSVGTMVKAGYDFAGWSDGTTTYTTTFTPTTIFTLTPVWTAHTYTISFSKTSGATGNLPANQSWTSGTPGVTLSGNIGSPALALTGYTFGGWAAASAPATQVTTYSTFSNQVFVPIWIPVAYSVTYNLNGGDGNTPIQPTLNINQAFTFPTPTRANYAFLGWQLNGSSSQYSAGYTFVIGAATATSMTFTAQWIAQFTVSYAMNGSTTVESDPSNLGLFNSGTSITLPPAPNAITGYTFAGWLDSNAIMHDPSSSFTVIQNSVLSAQWSAIAYHFAYSLGAVSGTAPTSTIANFNTTFTVAPAPTKPGYTFLNWNTSSDGTGNAYLGSQPYAVVATGDLTLTAQWLQVPYTVTYDLGGGTGSTPAQLTGKHVGDSFTLPAVSANPTWKAHTFLNWSDGTSSYAAGSTYTVGAANVVLTAIFQLNGTTSISYSFGSNPGSGTLPTQVAQLEGTVITIKSGQGLTRSGYTFGGWTDGSNSYASADSYVVPVYTNPVTFSPIWLAGYSVTYSAGTGSGSVPTDSTLRFSADTFAIPSASGLSNPGFNFMGWSDGSATYQPSSTYTVGNSSITLTAQWLQSSLYAAGSTPKTVLDHKTLHAGVGYPNETFSLGSSTVSYNVPADAFGAKTDNMDLYVYALADASALASILPTNQTYILPTIITWLAADGTVPTSIVPLIETVTSNQIQVGTIAYAISGSTVVTLGTATQAGSMNIEITSDPVVVLANPIVVSNPAPSQNPAQQSQPDINAVAVAAAAAKALADAQAAAAEKAAEDAAKTALEAAQVQAAADAKAAQDAANAKAAAELQAAKDAADAAANAARSVKPAVTLYSITAKLTLSSYDTAYLNQYVESLKNGASVTCVGYIYKAGTTLAKATSLARNQASAVCALMKRRNKTLKISILLVDAKQAPRSANGAKWVAVSYRIDSFKPRSK